MSTIDDIRAKLKMAKDANENFRPIPDEALIYDVEIRALLDQHDADQRELAARDARIAALETALKHALPHVNCSNKTFKDQDLLREVMNEIRAVLKGTDDEEAQ